MQRGCLRQQGKYQMSNEAAPLLNKHFAGCHDEMFPQGASLGVIAQSRQSEPGN
jgi:hypothetical protein